VTENRIANQIVDAAIQVQRTLGPGLLESVYETVMAYELDRRHLRVDRQRSVPIKYRELHLPSAFRLDLVVEDSVIVEIKSVKDLAPVHHVQLLTYLRLTGAKLGLLINFNECLVKNGISRVVNNL
jgi:GxxExxY protein